MTNPAEKKKENIFVSRIRYTSKTKEEKEKKKRKERKGGEEKWRREGEKRDKREAITSNGRNYERFEKLVYKQAERAFRSLHGR